MVNVGRLFKLRLRRSYAAREAAKATIRKHDLGWFEATVGGPVKGRTILGLTARDVADQIDTHYNAAMSQYVLDLSRRSHNEARA